MTSDVAHVFAGPSAIHTQSGAPARLAVMRLSDRDNSKVGVVSRHPEPSALMPSPRSVRIPLQRLAIHQRSHWLRHDRHDYGEFDRLPHHRPRRDTIHGVGVNVLTDLLQGVAHSWRMNEHRAQQPWATQSPRLALTWVMTSHGLRMQWNANSPESARVAVHTTSDRQPNVITV